MDSPFGKRLAFVLILLLVLAAAPGALAATGPTGDRDVIPGGIPNLYETSVAAEPLAVFLDGPAAVWVDDDYTSATSGWDVDHFASIQAGIDAVAAGGMVNVYPGIYDETAVSRYLYNATGPYQFGLFFADEKPGVTVQGLKADGSPITAYADVAATVRTNATNSFGYSGIFVEADNTTIAGLRIGPNTPSDNKTIEVIGENFTLKNSVIDVSGGGSVYINDWRYDNGTATSYVTKYTVEGNWLKYGGSVDISSGAGVTGLAADRKIINNKFTADGENPYWALVSFNGIVPSVGWFTYPVGGATVTGNDFSGSTQYIRSRGTVAGGFDWASYWANNTFDKAVLATTDGNPANPRPFDYTSGTYFINNTLRIGAAIQPEVDIAQAGDTILVKAGTYTENVNVNKALNLRGATGGDFSSTVPIAASQAPGVWYPDRYAPAVFESYDFGGEMVLRHGIRATDVQGNSFYNYQGRKLDTNLTGTAQSMSIDLWLDASWNGASRNAGIWSTGFDSGSVASAYPIVAWRSGGTDPAGFYAFDYINGGWLPLKMATVGDYGRWHTLTFVFSVGTGVEYFVDGVSRLTFADPDTANLRNLILNAYNFGADYDVYWDNFRVGSTTPTPYEPVVTGVMNITASAVEVTGLYLQNPGFTNAVVIAGTSSDVTIANNRIQDVGSETLGSVVHAILMSNGADQVRITRNTFSNLRALNKSLSAIGVLDSAATNSSEGLLIEGNTLSDIVSVGATKGAYGVIINNKVGAPAAQILNNTFNGLSGGWTHAIGLEGPTPNALIQGNSFSGLTAAGADNIAVHFEDNPVAATVVVTGNQFNGGGYYGVAVNPDDMAGGANGLCYSVNAENNWWNSAEGPTGAGAVPAGPQVDYSPWWTDAAGTGTASSGSGSDVEFVIPAGASTATQNAIIACAAGETITYLGDPVAGGVVVNTPGVTINLNGFTVGAGSPAFTINADDVTLQGPGALDGNDTASPAVLVNAGADNFTLKNVEVRKWADGVEIAGDVVSLKIVDNFIWDNADAGLQINSGVNTDGVVNIYGNLFKVNGGNGIQNDGATADLPAQYNSWGDIGGPAAGDGVSGNVDAANPTYLEYFIDMDPDTLATARRAGVGTSFDVMVKGDARKVNGIAFKVAYDNTVLQLNTATYQGDWAGATCLDPTLAVGSVTGTCYLQSGEWDGDAAPIMKLNFTVLALPSSPYPSALDILHAAVDTNAGAYGGAKVYVNNAGYGLPSVPARDITDTDDGTLTLGNLANYTGFIDLQGRTNDSGATLLAKNIADKPTSVDYASGTSVSSGAYTTAHLTPWMMFQGETFWFQVDRALYLPTTQMGTTPSDTTIPGSWVHSKPLSSIPTTPLLKVVLLGGDGTDDDVIDVLDAGCMGSSYYGASVCGGGPGANSDVNGDGVTDILDLSLMGGNYYKVESPWTP